ncbi:VOC family protein [Legionella spiritensis]|uniref:VOC family protein n=1 Tax=Legionella spiritensis TaxID=452 RepID=UPI000F6E5689|nr:VOC family protein [Legionella spiritensis]VEG92115.1 Glyoxalase-like domain [Legionella spiritensis]
MLKDSKIFSSFSADDLEKEKQFYGDTLELDVQEEKGMGLNIRLANGGSVFIYPKENHEPATFTVLNFIVNDIDEAVDALVSKGVQFERYEGFEHDKKRICRSDDPSKGPSIAWFKDPCGNILSILQE